MGWVVNATPRPNDPVPIVQEAGWAPGPVWTGAKNVAPTGIRSPDHPARSESLYRLSYLKAYDKWHFKPTNSSTMSRISIRSATWPHTANWHPSSSLPRTASTAQLSVGHCQALRPLHATAQRHPWRHILGGCSVRDWPPVPLTRTRMCVWSEHFCGTPVETRNAVQFSVRQRITTFLYKSTIQS
jgi:hypothetical protein